jgi:hypothetical protein
MNILTFKKSISTMVMVAYTTMTSLIPAGQAVAAPICSGSTASEVCAVKQFPTGAYAYAKFQWNQVGQLDQSPKDGITIKMASGDRVVASNNRTATALGLQANQVADVMSLFPTGVPFVFARFNPMSGNLSVDVFKVEKAGGKMTMMQAPFTPAHGGAFAAAMTYATPSDRANGFSPGKNPFDLFNQPGNDAFHNVGMGAVQVIVGHAMQAAGASVGLVAVAKTRPNQYQTKSGGWFKKTITTHVEGFTKPEWYVVTPAQFQPHGASSQYCAIDVPNPADCPQQLAVKSGVVWSQWTGGSLPAFEDMTSNWTESKSSFTLLAMIAVTFLIVMTAGALAVAAGAGATALGPATFIQGLMATGAGTAAGGLTMSTVLTSAAIEAAAVGVVGGLSGAGLSDGVIAPYQGARSGFEVIAPPTGAAQRSLYDGTIAKFDTPTITAVGVRAVSQGLYGTSCTPGASSTECTDSGVVPRKDTGAETNNIQFWHDNGKPLPVSSPYTQR